MPPIVIHAARAEALSAICRARFPGIAAIACTDHAALPTLLAEHDAEIVFSIRFGPKAAFPGAALFGARSLRWLAVGGSGVGHLRGAALDVFDPEPLAPEDALWDAPRLLISPHSSGGFDGWAEAATEFFCDNLERWRAGAPLVSVVDPSRGY